MSTGIKVRGKGNKIHDNIVSGSDVGYDIEGEDNDIKGNKYFPPLLKLKPLVAAVKKPSANGNRGLKIIIGMIAIPILVGVAVHEYGLWRGKQSTNPNQEQHQELTPKSSGNEK